MTTAAPLPVAPAPRGTGRSRWGAGDVAKRLTLRAVLALIGAAAAIAGAAVMWRHSMRDSNFGPYFADPAALTPVTRYSGPWIVGAAGLALVAGLLGVVAVFDGYRALRVRRSSRPGQ